MSEASENARVEVALMEAEHSLLDIQGTQAARAWLADSRPRNPLFLISALLIGPALSLLALYGAGVADSFRVVFGLLCTLVTFLALDNFRISRRLEAAIRLVEASARPASSPMG